MHRTVIVVAVAVAVTATASCTSKPPRSGIPQWDYERDTQHVSGSLLDPLAGMTSGNYDERVIIGAVVGVGVVGALRDMGQGRIGLTPTQLRVTIVEALRTGYIADSTSEANLTRVINGTAALNDQPLGARSFSWEIAELNEGIIVTNWRPVPGKTAGLLWWAREYETQARHIITIMRSLDYPEYSNFSITTEVRERPNSNYPWRPGDPEMGRESFQQLRKTLMHSIRNSLQASVAEARK